MKNIPTNFEQAFNQFYDECNKAITKISNSQSGKEYATAAFNGGSRDFFESEADINSHYGSIDKTARENGLVAMNNLLKAMKESLDQGLKIDTVKAAEAQLALPLIKNNAALLRYVSDPDNRDNYTVIASVSNYKNSDETQNLTAANIGQKLDAYENSLSEVVRKTEKYIDQALKGDKNSIDGWSYWIQCSIDDAKSRYEALQQAIDDTTEKSTFMAMMTPKN